MNQPPERAEEPRAEPEIIPPGHTDAYSARKRSGVWIAVDAQGTQRVYFAKPGPLGIALIGLAIGFLLAAVLVVILGALVISIPVIGLILAAAVIVGLAQRFWRRPP